jgi:hypothetical protein
MRLDLHRPSGRRLAGFAALAACAAVVALLLGPWRLDGPMNDEWAYLIPARRLAETGVLRLTDWTAPTQLLQLACGALLIKLFGYHVGMLKCSTFACASASSAIFFQLLLEEGAPAAAALLASLSLLLCPLALPCDVAFITDAPYLTLELAALYALCRGRRLDDDRWLAAGGAAAAAAFFVRQVGLFIPAGAVIELWRERRLDGRRAALLFGPVLIGAVSYWGWFHFIHGPTVASVVFAAGLAKELTRPDFAGTALGRFIESCITVGLVAFPFAVGLLRRSHAPRKTEWLANLFVLTAAVWIAVRGPLPYSHNTFKGWGLGWVTVDGPSFKDGGFFGTQSFWAVCTILGLAGGWLLAARAGDALRGARGGGARLLAWSAILQFLPLLAWPFFLDRYLLPTLPFVLGLVALAASRPPFSFRASAAVLALASVVWLAGAFDYVAWNRAESELLERARARGVAMDKVAAGWDWDAYYNYDRIMAELKAKKPFDRIGVWDWRNEPRRDLVVTFEPHPETHWKGVELMDKQTYWTPISTLPGAVYLFRVPAG